MSGTNLRIIRVENGWRLIIGDWAVDGEAVPVEKVAARVKDLLEIVGAWAEPSDDLQEVEPLDNQSHGYEV